MSCHTRQGVKPIIDLIEKNLNVALTSQDWHDLRKLAEAEKADMGRRRLDRDEIQETMAILFERIQKDTGQEVFELNQDGGTWVYDRGEWVFEEGSDYVSDNKGGWDEPPYDANLPEEPADYVQDEINKYENFMSELEGNLTEGTAGVLGLMYGHDTFTDVLTRAKALSKADGDITKVKNDERVAAKQRVKTALAPYMTEGAKLAEGQTFVMVPDFSGGVSIQGKVDPSLHQALRAAGFTWSRGGGLDLKMSADKKAGVLEATSEVLGATFKDW